MEEDISFAPGLLRIAGPFLGRRTNPKEKILRAALESPVRWHLEGGLPGPAPEARTMPPLLRRFKHFYCLSVRRDLRLFADEAGSSVAPPNSLVLGLDRSLEGSTRVTSLGVVEEISLERIHPHAFEWSYEQAAGLEVIRWGLIRDSRPYTVRVTAPLDRGGPWSVRVVGIYAAGERVPLSGGEPLIARARNDIRVRLPERRGGGGWEVMREEAAVVTYHPRGVFESPQDAFVAALEWLPGSGSHPNSRLGTSRAPTPRG